MWKRRRRTGGTLSYTASGTCRSYMVRDQKVVKNCGEMSSHTWVGVQVQVGEQVEVDVEKQVEVEEQEDK